MGTLIGIIGIVITLYAIKLQFFSDPKEELEHLTIQFRATQALSIELQYELEKVIKEKNIGECELYYGISYKKYLEVVKASHQKYLSDEVFNKTKSLRLTKTNILSMTQSLEKQFEALSEVRNYLKITSIQYNS